MSCGEYEHPGSRWDYALLAAAVTASVPFIIANVVIFLHRKLRYFQAQGGALLILTSSIAGLIWIVASFIINFHIPRNHPVLRICPLWSFWLQLTFGFWLWFACQIIRLLHLHRLCQNASSAASAYPWIFVYALILWSPGLVFAIIATSLHASALLPSDPNFKTVCKNCIILTVGWKYCLYLILPSSYFAILVYFLYRFRKIKDHMMAIEYSHTSEYSLIMAFVIYLLYGATVLSESQKKIPGRCFLTFCICFLVFVNFWVRLGWPVYLCLFKSETEMDDFEEELRSYGTECLDKFSAAAGISQARGRTLSSLQCNDWILRAIGDAMNEASECKERIHQLQQQKLALSAKIALLEGSATPQITSSPASARRL